MIILETLLNLLKLKEPNRNGGLDYYTRAILFSILETLNARIRVFIWTQVGINPKNPPLRKLCTSFNAFMFIPQLWYRSFSYELHFNLSQREMDLKQKSCEILSMNSTIRNMHNPQLSFFGLRFLNEIRN